MKTIKYLFIILIISISACEIGLNDCIDGDGNKTEREIEVDGEINAIEFKLSGELLLRKGDTQRITIEGDQNIVDLIESESRFRNNTWIIDGGNDCIDADGLKIIVQLRSIDEVYLLGSGDIKSDNTLQTGDSFKAELDGSGKIDIEVGQHMSTDVSLLGSGLIQMTGSTDELEVSLKGSGDIDLDFDGTESTRVDAVNSGEIKLKGSTIDLTISLIGSGDIKADDYRSQDCTIDLAGSGDIEVFVENTLDINIAGSGDVCYKGNPTVTVNVVGSGDVRDCN